MKKVFVVLLMALCLVLGSTAASAAVIEVAAGGNLQNAVNSAAEGDTIKLMGDVTISQLDLRKKVTLDLNGHTLTTTSGYGGVLADKNCTITSSAVESGKVKKGKILHTGRTVAIKVWEVAAIENIEIEVTDTTAGKTIGAIAIQGNRYSYVESIKNVDMYGAGLDYGIEVIYREFAPTSDQPAFGVVEKVDITAKEQGMKIVAPAGTVKDSEIKGEKQGITMFRKGVGSVALTLDNCEVYGEEAGVYASDEKAGLVGSMNLDIDQDTTLTSKDSDYSLQTNLKSEEMQMTIGSAAAGECYVTNAKGEKIFFEGHVWSGVKDAHMTCKNCGKQVYVPQTGDSSRMMMWLSLLMMSGAVLMMRRAKAER